MAKIEYAERALADVERLVDFLMGQDPSAAEQTLELIESALAPLKHHPLIGRPKNRGLHELVISRGSTGYLALYRYDEALDRILILAVRHQREAGY
ncbi:MAG: type II toxin-antitoxin system RelE/ParE family toxin [Nitrosomonadales bacterium]|nr:type II toxin-antitoxin system RelE/ParE family toxin [Nitrosomonadales bacterium]